jgi:hypothetical protein
MDFWVLFIIVLTFLVLFPFMRNERVHRLLTCPRKNTPAKVELVQRYHNPSKPIRITSCNLLSDPKRVDCGQDCIKSTA